MSLKPLMNTKFKKGIINAIIFVLLVSLTFYIIFKDHNILEILEIMKQTDKKFIALAILCMFCFIFSEGINIARTLKLLRLQNHSKKWIKIRLCRIFLQFCYTKLFWWRPNATILHEKRQITNWAFHFSYFG